MNRSRSLLFLLAVVVSVFGFVACPSEDDSADTSGGGDGTKLNDAYFISNMVRMAKLNESCDLDTDGKPNNALLTLASQVSTLLQKPGADQTLATAVQNGKLLMVIGVHDVQSFDADDNVKLELYAGALDDTDTATPPPSDLFSGTGAIAVKEPSYAAINGSFDKGQLVVSDIEKVGINVPVGEEVVLTEVVQPVASASVSPYPNAEMLAGKVPEVKICGAIKAKTLIDIAAKLATIPALLQPAVAGYINSLADLDCDGEQCLSMGIIFSAVSVEKL